MKDPKLSERMTIRLSYADAQRIASAARAAGITPSELIRRVVVATTLCAS